MRSVILAALAMAAIALPAEAEDALAVGQVWTFENASAPTARVVIDRLEPYGEQQAAHVTITGLDHPAIVGGTILHLPFDRTALVESLDTLETTNGAPFDGYEAGYDQWLAAKGGVLTVPVSEAIDFVVQTVERAGRLE